MLTHKRVEPREPKPLNIAQGYHKPHYRNSRWDYRRIIIEIPTYEYIFPSPDPDIIIDDNTPQILNIQPPPGYNVPATVAIGRIQHITKNKDNTLYIKTTLDIKKIKETLSLDNVSENRLISYIKSHEDNIFKVFYNKDTKKITCILMVIDVDFFIEN